MTEKIPASVPTSTDADLLHTWNQSTWRTTWADSLRRATNPEHRAIARKALATYDDHSPIDGLAANAELSKRLEQQRWHVMRDAREHEHTWAEIGDALGVTRQAAQQAYAKACESHELLRGRSYGPSGDDMAFYRAALDDT